MGISHIIVTNISVWFKFILEETFDSVKHGEEVTSNSSTRTKEIFYQRALGGNKTNTSSTTTSQAKLQSSDQCEQLNTQVSDIIARLIPFLHPCAIEYSIICVTLFYVIWYNVGRKTQIHKELVHIRRFSLVAAQTYLEHIYIFILLSFFLNF